VKKQSNLKKLARQFYGSPLYYPVIIMYNFHINCFEIQANTMIRIVKNRRQVKHIYNIHREKDKERLFWRYTTNENDTIVSICQKFYHTQQPDIPIVNLNPENRLRPGEIVKIRLE
ncbi:MAG TPA: hypothetical protein VLP30_05885, partial [Desulfatirhabdiaceae bacterium]|nr:hypothetical protein [Desulfatirhabdiaceae bacterium]